MTTQSKQKKLKGGRQKLKIFRSNEPLTSVLMWGINHSLTTLQHVKPRAVLLKDDFKAFLKIKVRGHLFNKENMPSRFKFKEYCPLAFQNLRERFNVDTNDYWDSLTRYEPLWDTVRGKSGSKFLVTYNRHYVLKSISSEEVEQMHHFIENYHEYIVNHNGQTLLPHYLGLYRITVNDQETYLLAMRNIFSPRIAIHKKYDLKGSNVDREANEKEKSKPLPTLKDNDFLHDICKLHMEESPRLRLLEHLKRDISFLQSNNLMDYSAVIGIHDVEMAPRPFANPAAADLPLESNAATDAGGGAGVGSSETVVAISAGDGMGEVFEQMLSRMSHPESHSQKIPQNETAVNSFAAPEGMQMADLSPNNTFDYGTPASSWVSSGGNLTPPESPSDFGPCFQSFSGDLNPITEFYGFQGSQSLGRPVIYFIAVIDILTRYGMRKRTAQTYKTVKHVGGNSTEQITTVKPEVYGPRLLEFVTHCVE